MPRVKIFRRVKMKTKTSFREKIKKIPLFLGDLEFKK